MFVLRGKVVAKKRSITIINPEIGTIDSPTMYIKDGAKNLVPKYGESKGLTSKWIGGAILKIFDQLKIIEEPIPKELLKKYSLPKRKEALLYAHFPKEIKYYEAAKKRFAFEEIFFLHLIRGQSFINRKREGAEQISIDKKLTDNLIAQFPFTPTNAQRRVIDDILSDLKKDAPMARLLEGDVGSGKTAVAAAILHSVVLTKPKDQDFGTLQVAYMAPTELLATQQFEAITHIFKHLPISIGLITSNICKKFPSKIDVEKDTKISKAQLKKWVANGEIAIVVGTHALIQKDVAFKHLALVIVDEQHRFGVAHRQKLLDKSKNNSTPPINDSNSNSPHLGFNCLRRFGYICYR